MRTSLQRRFVNRGWASLALMPLAAMTAWSADKITYEDHILPIFEQACMNCHNPDKTKGGLDLSSYGGTMKGSSGGKIIESGDGASSPLFNVVTHSSEPEMPPEGDKLEKKQSDLIRAWIDGGVLETQSSKARKPSGPKIDLAIQTDSTRKPEGPPPMPGPMSLEPVVVGARSAVVADMTASPWAPLLAVTGQKQILLYHTETLRLVGILPFPSGQPETVSFHPSGKYLLAGGGIAGKSGTTITWDITTGKELMRNGREFDSVLAASLRNDLSSVALGGPSRLIKIWDTQSAEQSHSIKKHTDWITGLSYSPDGILLATADRNGGAWVWEAGTGNEFHILRAHQKAITAVSWRADSNLLATASEDGQVIFWEMNNGKQAKKIDAHQPGVLAFDYARDGRFATAGRDRRVKLWQPDFNLKKELPEFSQFVVELAFSQDGKRLFTADLNGLIEVWDTETFEKLGTLESNPPHLATRLAALQSKLAEAPGTLAKAQETFDSAKRPLEEARKKLAETTTKRDAARKQLNAAKHEQEQLHHAWNDSEAKRNQLVGPRKTKQQKLNQARNALNNHRKSLQRSGEDLQKAARHRDELRNEEGALAAHENQNADALKGIRTRLTNARQEATSASTRVDQLTKQLGELEKAFQESEGGWKEISRSWDANEETRKRLAQERSKLAERTKKLSSELPPLEKAIKPQQDAVAAHEKKLAPARQAFEATRKTLAALTPEFNHWQSAAATSAYLQGRATLETLQALQETDRKEFSSLCNSLAQLGNDAAERTTVSQKIATLKTAIDVRATEEAKLHRHVNGLRARSEKLSAQP